MQTESPSAAVVGETAVGGGDGRVEFPAVGAVAAGAEAVIEGEGGDVGGGGEPVDDPAPLELGAVTEDNGAPGPSSVL